MTNRIREQNDKNKQAIYMYKRPGWLTLERESPLSRRCRQALP